MLKISIIANPQMLVLFSIPTVVERERQKTIEAEIRAKKQEVDQSLDRLVKKLNDVVSSLRKGSDLRKLLDNLIAYFNQSNRSFNRFFESFYDTIPAKITFANNLVNIITDQELSEAAKIDRLETYLSETNIAPFNGIIFKRTYNQLKNYQFFSQKRQQAIWESTLSSEGSMLPKVLIQMIGDYDKELHSFEDNTQAII